MTAQQGLDHGLREFLREHEAKPAYLAEVFAATSRTRQRRRSITHRLIDALTGGMSVPDRQAMRIAVIGLLLAALVGVALVAAAIRLRGDDDPDAFALAAYQQVATDLPAMRLVIRENVEGVLDLVIFYDGDRRVRQEYGDWTKITGSDFIAERQPDVPGQAWVVSERAPVPVVEQVEQVLLAISKIPTNCAAGYESMGDEVLIGRTTRHLRCMSGNAADARNRTDFHLWIDLETGLPLQVASPQGSILHYVHVAELEIGPQPESLFVVDGETISVFEHECRENGGVCPPSDPQGPAASTAPPPAGPLVTPVPVPGRSVAPANLDTFVAEAHAAYEASSPLEIRFSHGDSVTFSPGGITGWLRDGLGNYRAGDWLSAQGRRYEFDPREGKHWRRWSTGYSGALVEVGAMFPPKFDLPAGCGIGWNYLGDDLVLDRPAAHLVCGLQEFWIDREWMLVTRAHDHDLYLGDDPAAGLSEVISVTFGPQPTELFEAPSPDDVWY